MPRSFSFAERLEWSEGQFHRTTPKTINEMLGGRCTGVYAVTDLHRQRAGIDYCAVLRGGGRINIDHKAREAGCSKFWRNGPEFALETWSVVPGTCADTPSGAVGWTLDEAKRTHYVLFTFAPEDCGRAFLIPFQLLRVAFRRNYRAWFASYRTARQATNHRGRSWQSECLYVPAVVCRAAVVAAMEAAAA